MGLDRPAAIRRALRDLVAERGFHGASMSAIAARANVATGTAYVHYESKDELVLATYLEIKREMGDAVAAAVDPRAAVADRYRRMWLAAYRHLAEEPERARFLTQLEESPYYDSARELVMEQGDKIMEIASHEEFTRLLVPLPMEVIYVLTMGVAVRLVAAGIVLSNADLDVVVDATRRAVTRDGAG
jgi:AcrR family transcriptional regulator